MKEIKHVTTEEGYDLWADTYDSDANPMLDADAAAVGPLLPPLRGKTVVDLGCGTGRWLSRFLDEGAVATGVDASQAMLDKAREKFGDNPRLRLELLNLDTELPLEPASFDLVFSSLVLEHIEDLAHFFGQLPRLMRPDGLAVVSTMHPAMFLRDIQAHLMDRTTGEEVRFTSYPHQVSDFVMAALRAGLEIEDMAELLPSQALALHNPRLAKFVGWPMVLVLRLSRRA
ncbi:class I SAM-dependent methyltransferase [Fundidesulfovibrio butyratiphilus]